MKVYMYYVRFNKDYEDFKKGQIYIFDNQSYKDVISHYSLYRGTKSHNIHFRDLEIFTFVSINDYRQFQINKI